MRADNYGGCVLRKYCWNQQQVTCGQQQLALHVASASVTILPIVKSEQVFSYTVSTSCAAELERRNLSRGQQVMALAMIDPEAEKGGEREEIYELFRN
jgi:hypothetical protein